MTSRADSGSRANEEAQWDDDSDERERLADERERLADHEERAADRSMADVDDAAHAAIDQLRRADVRLQRAVAEQQRALAAVERMPLHDERGRAAAARMDAAAAASALDDDELAWSRERHDFVSAARDTLADARDVEADARDDLASAREREADARDRAARQREALAAQHHADVTGTAAGLDKATERTNRELAALREAARRQRAATADSRRLAVVDRAETGRRRASTGAGRDPYGPNLVSEFTALTGELFRTQDLFAVAGRVADVTLDCIPGAVAAAVTFFEGVRPIAHVATDDVAERLNAYQVARGTGPVTESLEHGEPVSVADLADDARWPTFRAMAAELGIRGVAACGLTVRRGQDWQPLGALTLYTELPDVFDADVADEVSLFAAHLAVVAAFDRDRHDVSRREAALHRALSSRDVIGQAKGILMERRHIPAGEAFDTLRRTSQRLNVRIQELATKVAETGELAE
jgi:hypothetical protein